MLQIIDRKTGKLHKQIIIAGGENFRKARKSWAKDNYPSDKYEIIDTDDLVENGNGNIDK